MPAHPSRLARAALGGAIVAVVAVHGAPASWAQQSPPGVESCPSEYVIGQEDVLEIAVWNNATITRTVPVRPDGKISLPLLDDLQAAGFTAMELRERLEK